LEISPVPGVRRAFSERLGSLPPSLFELRRTRSSQELLAMTASHVHGSPSTSLRALAKQSRATRKNWIASSQELLAMTALSVAT
jgi:hypothetical protein